MLLAAAVVSLLFGLLGAWAYDHFYREDMVSAEPAVATSTAAPEVASPSLSATELEPLKTRLGELGEQVDKFEKQLDEASSKENATADLAPIRQQIDGVAKALGTIDPLAKQLDGINARMEGLETSVNSLKEDLESLEPKAAEPAKENILAHFNTDQQHSNGRSRCRRDQRACATRPRERRREPRGQSLIGGRRAL